MNGVGVTILRTGSANVASVVAAFERLGCTARLSDDASEARDARLLVLPGVGSFGAGMRRLCETGLDSVILERVNEDRPLLGICLGLQLLCASSEESPGIAGLAVVEAGVTRFRSDVRVPQMGWNRVIPFEGSEFLREGAAYFANSYKLDGVPSGWTGAMARHGDTFVAALERGRTLACQFHPELSGAFGESLLRRWLVGCTEGVGSC